MASTASLALSHSLPNTISRQRIRCSLPTTANQVAPPPRRSACSRRDLLLLLTATTATTAVSLSPAAANAQDIPLFGLRRKIEKVEEEAEELVKEGIEGIESAEKGLEAAEKKAIESAEDEIETVLGFGGLAQAAVVAGAELLGVVVATSVVNGILRPDAKRY